MSVNLRELELRPIIQKQDSDFRALEKTMEQQLFQAKVKNDLGAYEEAYTLTQTALHDYKQIVSDRESTWLTPAHSAVYTLSIKAQYAARDYLANFKSHQATQPVPKINVTINVS